MIKMVINAALYSYFNMGRQGVHMRTIAESCLNWRYNARYLPTAIVIKAGFASNHSPFQG